jgi:P pilus assembly chaperone PapD
MNKTVVGALTFAAATSACVSVVHTNSTLIDPTARLARSCAESVKLYLSPDSVKQPYRQVALMNSAGQVNLTNQADMYASLREEAAEVGANGILLDAIDEPTAITLVAANTTKTSLARKAKAMAIWVQGDSAKTAVACAKAKPRSKPSSFWRWIREG